MKNKFPDLLNVDYVVPVPAHIDKIKERGFNQVELILKSFSEKNSLKSLSCLEQIKNYEMRKLNLEERYEQVRGAFVFNPLYAEEINNSHILLIDDVVTTCATASECAQILLNNGARKVDVLACGRNKLD